MSISQRVFDLYQIELAIQDKRKQVEDINSRIDHNEAYERAKEELITAEKRQSEAEKQHKDLDGEAEELRKSIVQINDKLYGGKIKNPKELVGYEQEADMIKANLRKKDDVLLELMEKIETGKTGSKELRQNLSLAEKKWNSEKEQLTVQAETIKNDLNSLEQRYQSIRNLLDKETIAAYTDIKSRKGQAVVKVEQGRCLGCRVSLSVNELHRVRGNAIVTCSNCGRILYLS